MSALICVTYYNAADGTAGQFLTNSPTIAAAVAKEKARQGCDVVIGRAH